MTMAEIFYLVLESTVQEVQERILRKKTMKMLYELINCSVLTNSTGQISDECGKT